MQTRPPEDSGWAGSTFHTLSQLAAHGMWPDLMDREKRVVYQVNLLAYFDLVSPWPFVGWIITGVLIGRRSNFIHDFATRWLTKPPFDP
jgi:hypothetical protein